MRKYWKLIALSVFTVVVFGAFYISATSLTSTLPQFSFHKLDGNDQAVESLVINGDVFVDTIWESFKIDKDGTKYIRDKSFIDRFIGHNRPIAIEKLQKEYRNFMRGKEEDPKAFFENDDVIAYGSTPYDIWTFDNFSFDIAVLDKHTNKTTSFTLPIPNRKNYSHIEPYGVKFKDDKLSMVTLNSVYDEATDEENTQVHIYTFDTKKKQLIDNEVIVDLTLSYSEIGFSNVDLFLNDKSKDEDHLVVLQNFYRYVDTTDDEVNVEFNEVVEVKEAIKYNFETGAKEEITLPKDEDIGIPFAFVDDKIYFAKIANNNLTISGYDSNGKKLKNNLDIPLNNKYVSTSEIYQGFIKDGVFYFVPSSVNYDELGSVIVVDLKSLTLSYNGQIAISNPPENGEWFDVFFYSIDLKD